MQQPKVFYPQHETYASRPLERTDGQQRNRCFPAFVLPENLASVGTPSLYHPSSQDLCAAPPAGFHMAPCGCFFDPRIYRIEWATANFVQPSMYKLSGGPNPQNSYLLDNQKYLKGSVQPLPYAPYQPVASNSLFAMPFFKPEGSPAKLTDHTGFVANLAHGSPFVEVPRLPGESLMPVEDHKLLAVVQSSSLKDPQQHPSQMGPYQPLDPRPGLAFPIFKSFPVEEADFKVSEMPLGMGELPLSPGIHPEEPVPCGGMEQLEPCVNLEGILPRETSLMEEPGEAFQLLDQVPLEDAMKLFDCSPIHSDTEAPLDDLGGGGQAALPGEAVVQEGCFSGGEDSSSDIRSLNLPDELLSFDYSVPEILSAVTSLDYLYDVNSFGEEIPWEGRLGSPLPLPRLLGSPTGLEEKRRNLGPANRARKPEWACIQGGDRETPEGNSALLAL